MYDPSISYVNTALDSPTLSYYPDYVEFLTSRAESLFKNSSSFTPEEFYELRRIGDRLSTFQKVVDFDYFNYAAQTPITSVLHHRVPADSFKPAGASYFERSRNYMSGPDVAAVNCELFLNEFPWYYRPYFFIVGFFGKIFDTINAYVGPYTEHRRLVGKNMWVAGSVFDPRSPELIFNNSNRVSTKPNVSGCGTSSAFTQKREDPSQYFSDVNIYIGSLKPLSEYAGKIYISLLGHYFQEIQNVLTFSTVNAASGRGAVCILMFSGTLFLLILVSVFVIFRSGTIIAIAIVFEAISVCLVIIYSIAGTGWYDPMSSILGFSVIVMSAVEMAVLLSVFVVISR